METLMGFVIYGVSAVASFMIARKIGVSRWLAIVLAWLGPIGLIGTLIGLRQAWRSGIPIKPAAKAAEPTKLP
jgi:hypothetical protein